PSDFCFVAHRNSSDEADAAARQSNPEPQYQRSDTGELGRRRRQTAFIPPDNSTEIGKVKNESAEQKHHLDSKRFVAVVSESSREKHERARGKNHRDGPTRPRRKLMSELGNRLLAHYDTQQAQTQEHGCPQQYRQS